MPRKNKVIVLTDIGGDPDDQMSMVRLMIYSNQIDIEGLVATDVKQTVNPERIQQIVEAYGKVRDNLELHEQDFLQPNIYKNTSPKEFLLAEWMA